MPRRQLLLTAMAVTAVAGAIVVVVGVRAQQSAPTPPSSVGSVEVAPSPMPSTAVPLGPSRPTRISIKTIGVDSKVFPIGLAADGTLAVPQPGPRLNSAAWFENSPTPGQPGPSIIEGHLDSVEGPSVFFKLGELRPGDKITVTRADAVRVEFTVNAVRTFPKRSFPTDLVYGSGGKATPTLRLITCSDFDTRTRHHVGNEVVFAHLTHVTQPPTPKGTA